MGEEEKICILATGSKASGKLWTGEDFADVHDENGKILGLVLADGEKVVGVNFTQDGRSSTLIALRTRNDEMQKTGDKFNMLDEPNFGDSENSITFDLSNAKIKKKETTTAKINDYDSGFD